MLTSEIGTLTYRARSQIQASKTVPVPGSTSMLGMALDDLILMEVLTS